MIIKRVTAPTRQEAYEKLRKELGPDVEIIHAAPHRRGSWWFWRTEWYEVVGVRPDPAAAEVNVKTHPTVKAALELSSHGVAEIPQAPTPLAPAVPGGPGAQAAPANLELEALKAQVSGLTSVVTELASVLKRNAVPPIVAPLASEAGEAAAAPGGTSEPGETAARDLESARAASPSPGCSASRRDTQYVDQTIQALRKQELTEELSGEIRSYLLESLPERDLKQPKAIRERTLDYLASRLRASKGLDLVPGRKGKIVALVGPTGVGKTTTLAKLASGLMFNQHLDVAFITIDTYRIAAPEQLKKYAEIVEVPVEVAFRHEDMIELVHGLMSKDVILIDTVGRSPRSREDLLDLRRFLDFGLPVETHLLVSAVTKLSDLRAMAEGFRDLGYGKLLVTKTDETSTFGPILSLLAEHGSTVSYLTTGQTVPDDIVEATPERLASLAFHRRALTPQPPVPSPTPDEAAESAATA